MPDEYDQLLDAVLPRKPKPSGYDEIINRHSNKVGIDPKLVRAVIGQESSGNRIAVSPKGARGLMQLMPATAQRFGVKDVNDPEQNIRAGTQYLKTLSDRFGGDTDLMLAGYNAGEGAVEKYGRKIPPYKETQNYVPQVKARIQKQAPDDYDTLLNEVMGESVQPAQVAPQKRPLSELSTGGAGPTRPVLPEHIKPRKFVPAGPFQPATPQEQAQIKRAIPFKPTGPFGQASQEEQEVIRRAVAPTIRGQRMSTVPRVATEGVLEGAAGWTQSLESLSEMLPDVLAHVLPAARVAQTSGWNPVAKKLQEATDALRGAAEQTDIDPATGKPFRDAMSYWQSVPLDVLQAGVKSGFDIPRYVLLTRVAGPVMGFGIEGGLSAPPEERGKAVLAGTAMGGAFKGLEAVKPLVKTLPRRIGSFGALGATQTAGEEAITQGEVDPRSVMSSAITMGALGAMGGRRERKTETKQNVTAQPEAIRPMAARPGATEAVAQRMVASDAIVPETIRPPRMEVVEPQAWQHRDLGKVVEAPHQGVGKKRVRVVDESGKEHVIKRAALTGAGNQIAIPVKPAVEAAPAKQSAEVIPEGAQPAMETAPSRPQRLEPSVREEEKPLNWREQAVEDRAKALLESYGPDVAERQQMKDVAAREIEADRQYRRDKYQQLVAELKRTQNWRLREDVVSQAKTTDISREQVMRDLVDAGIPKEDAEGATRTIKTTQATSPQARPMSKAQAMPTTEGRSAVPRDPTIVSSAEPKLAAQPKPTSPVEPSVREGEAKAAHPLLREEVKSAVQKHFNLPEDQADAVSRITDARAETWAKQTGKPKEEWYKTRIAGITGGEPGKGALFQESQPFYSQLSRVVDQKMPNRASSEQLRAIVESPQSGVKADEIKWTGLDDFLKERPTVTKQEVQEFLRQNEVKVEEVTKGAEPNQKRVDEIGNELETIFRSKEFKDSSYPKSDELDRRVDALKEERDRLQYGDKTKFEKFQLPGGENYRELLLTLPKTEAQPKQYDVKHEGDYFRVYGKGADSWVSQHPSETQARESIRGRQARDDMAASSKSDFKSSHFDEPNVLAHVRFNDRVVDGKKVLFIEEVQSDWHQKGRAQGYKQPPITDKDIDVKFVPSEVPKGADPSVYPGYWESFDKRTGKMITRHPGRFNEAQARKEAKTFGDIGSEVPDAPFSKTWHELAMKRVLRHAAENGYDRVAWTTGEQQAERYDLSKHLNSVQWNPNNNKLLAYDKRSEEVINKTVTAERLADYVGKDLADKLVNAKDAPKDAPRRIEGVDLKVGGEGMKGFYDQILPSFMNKYGKKWGARVEQTRVDIGETPGHPSATQLLKEQAARSTAHSIDITPSMKKSVMEGQPLFQGKKASTEFLDDGRAIIRGLQKPDVSSAVHELGHVFRRDLDAPLLKSAEQWAGVKDGKWQTVHEEKFARGFERYLREGKAPTEQLRQVFAQFKEWLTNIYKTIKGSPIEGKLSPEIRNVFDTMLGKGGKQDAAVNRAALEEKTKPEISSVEGAGTPAPSIKPSDYINLKRLNISEEEKVNLGKTVSQMVSEGRVSKTKVTFEDIKREAAALDPNLVRNLKPVPPGETLRPEVRFAARERLNTLNSEAVRLQKELDASRITGEVKDLDALQAKLNTIENDSKGLLDVLIPTRSQDGRNLAYHNMMAQKSMDAEYWISRARRVAERSGEDVTGKSYQKKEQVIRQTLASGSEAEARVATLEKQIAELRTKLEKADSGAKPVTEPKRAFRQKVESLQARLDAQAEAAALRIKHLMDPAKLHDVTDFVQAVPDIAIWGAAKLAKKGVSAAAFAEEMVGAFGERIRPHLKEIYRQSYALYQKESNVLAEEAKVRTVTKGEPDKFTQPQIDKLLVETEAAKKQHQQARIQLARTFANLEKTGKLEATSLFIKAGLLTGFRTHEANIAGTAGHLAFEELSRVPASIVDMVVSAGHRVATGEYRRTISGLNPSAVTKSSGEAATTGVKEAIQILKHGASDRDLAKLEIKREMNSGWPIIDTYVNSVFRLLGAEDKVFRTYAEKRSREDQARVTALNEARKGTIKRSEISKRTKELAASPTAEMVATSIFDAEVATFNNQGSLAKGTHAFKRVLGSPGRFVFDRFVPFTQTPSNIVTRMLEATPLGAAYGPARAAYHIASKAFTAEEQRAFSQTMGRTVTGSGLIVLGYTLAAKGLMTGLRDDEPGKAGRDEAAGRSPMAVKAFGKWWQIGRMQPVSTLMIIGATLHREGHQELKDESVRPGKIAAIGTKAVLEQPMLKGVSALTDALSHPGQKVNSLAGGIAGSVVPTLVSDVGATIDNTRREAKSVKERIQVRLPGLRQSLPVDRDVFGDPLQSSRTAIIDPTLHTTAKEESSPMYKELVRLDASIPRSQRRQDEPAEAYQARLIAEGRAMKAAATQLTSMPRYKLLNDEEKREALKDAFAQAKDYVKKSGAAKAKKKVQGRSAGFKFNPRSLSAQ